MITMHIKLFYVSQILFQKSTALKSLIKVIPMLLLHVMMMLTKLFSVSQILYEKKLVFEKKNSNVTIATTTLTKACSRYPINSLFFWET